MTKLEQIVAAARQKVAESKASADMAALERRARAHTPRGFAACLRRAAAERPAIIAELKKASPSKGLIRASFEPASLAKELEDGGAAALSVLTNEEFFQGSLANLRAASAATKLPCLRKDFMVDEFQMVEARAHAADAVLLIVAALSDSELRRLDAAARAQGLDVLCEAHDENELQRALDAGCEVIGVNSRDLKTFHVEQSTLFRIGPKIPDSALKVAESGIESGEDVARLRAAGYQAFLIGESLMRAERPGEALKKLVVGGQWSMAGGSGRRG